MARLSQPARLGVASLAAATFFMVSGGPYGLEELVLKSGYGGAAILLLLVPVIWALPTSLMVGELAAALPVDGGFYVWVRRALGDFWGFQEAWLSLAASIFDMAAYPSLFVLSLGHWWPAAAQGANRILLSAAVIAICIVWNLFGARAVGEGSIWLGVLLLSPFALMVGFAISRAPHLAPAAPTQVNWYAGIIVAMWNFTGWDNASTVAQEVENPQRTYPRVMFGTLLVITAVYMIPVLAARHAGVPVASWTEGNWVGISAGIAGPWLGALILIATMISVVGMVNSLTMSYSRLPFAMAEDGYAPSIFKKRLANGAPWVSIVACGLAWTLALGLSFDRILLLDILLYGVSLILEFVALIVLRVKEPDLPRPFRIPGGIPGAIAIAIAPTALLIAAFLANRHEQVAGISAIALALGLMIAGVVAYFAMNRGQPR